MDGEVGSIGAVRIKKPVTEITGFFLTNLKCG